MVGRDEGFVLAVGDEAGAVSGGFGDGRDGKAAGGGVGPGETVGTGAEKGGDDRVPRGHIIEKKILVDEADGTVGGGGVLGADEGLAPRRAVGRGEDAERSGRGGADDEGAAAGGDAAEGAEGQAGVGDGEFERRDACVRSGYDGKAQEEEEAEKPHGSVPQGDTDGAASDVVIVNGPKRELRQARRTAGAPYSFNTP